jgi:hypothetical protein
MYELFGIKFVLTLTDIVVMVVCGDIFSITIEITKEELVNE